MFITAVLVGIILILALVGIAALGMWVYKDAKVNTDNPALWTAAVILVPNFLGLLVYLAVGRNSMKVICDHCGSYNNKKNIYCKNCGSKLEKSGLAEREEVSSVYIVVAIISITLCIFTLFGVFVFINLAAM